MSTLIITRRSCGRCDALFASSPVSSGNVSVERLNINHLEAQPLKWLAKRADIAVIDLNCYGWVGGDDLASALQEEEEGSVGEDLIEETMKIKDMVKNCMQDAGVDGLVDEYGECGCSIDDLFPCGNPQENCRFAFRSTDPADIAGQDCDEVFVPAKQVFGKWVKP